MSAPAPTVSVVIPCYNERGTLEELHRRIREEFAKLELSAEILFIDDGSNDGSREVLRALAAADPDCRVIFFRRNCGKAAALEVGFRAVRGEYVLTMDADLQDDPIEIPRFLEALQRVDLVSGWKGIRHDPLHKTLPSKLFNWTVRKVTGVPLHDMNCGFKGYRHQVVRELTVYGEMHRFLPALAAARGFRIEELVVKHHPRRSGVSKYGWERFVRGFFDLVTVVYLTRYRTRPLHLFGGSGLLCMFVAFILGLVLNVPLNLLDRPPAWLFWMWLLVVNCFTLGPILIAIGLVAEAQLANSFQQVPTPPVTEVLNFTDEVTHVG